MVFKICLIGCGPHAVKRHGPSLKKYAIVNSDVELTACCDINEQKAVSFQNTFNFKRHYTDLSEMLDIEKPDAVSLISPVHLTADLAVRILEMGYPLIMEKPPGRTMEEIMRMIKAADKNNVPNRVAFNRRYTPLVRELKRMLTERFKPEEIHNIRYDLFRVNRKENEFSKTAIHAVDAVRFLSESDYRHVRFHYQDLPQLGENVTNIYMDCTFTSGATAHINICPVAGVNIERAAVNALNHTFFVNIPLWFEYDSPGRLTHIEKNKIVTDVTGNDISDGNELFESSGFYYENETFFNDLKSGIAPKGDLKSAVQSVEVAECMEKRLLEYKGGKNGQDN